MVANIRKKFQTSNNFSKMSHFLLILKQVLLILKVKGLENEFRYHVITL